MGGWPTDVQKVVLGKQKPITVRPGEEMPPANLKKVREELAAKLKRDVTDDDLYSHLMYPEVFADFAKVQRDFGDVSVLPTPAFFYGLKPDEDIVVERVEIKRESVRDEVRRFLEDPCGWSAKHGGVASLEEAKAHKLGKKP